MKRKLRRLIGRLTAVALVGIACSSPPAEPDFLWDSLPTPTVAEEAPVSENQPAKQVPAKTWESEPEESGQTMPEEGDSVPSESAVPETPPQDLQGQVVLNEIYYDAVGSDTDGIVFIELYGTPGLAIGSAKINFVDGGDGSVDDAITLPDGARIGEDGFYIVADARTGAAGETHVAEADLIDNFDPQNGPDSVQLVDASGRLLDAVAYGEGAVASAENGLATFETKPAMDPPSGRSLERKEAGVDTDDNAADFVERETPTPGE